MKRSRAALLLTGLAATLLCSMTAFAGWRYDERGYWWDNGDGSYPANQWMWLDGNEDGISECYYFDGSGYMLSDTTTPDGYTVDKNGSILDYEMAVTDPYPGDITKDENGEILNGEDKPYQINCIEDLVEWSKNYTKYQESNIILCRNLDFGSKTSYADSKRTDFGNINGDEITESLIEELQKEKGFPGIKDYEGIFDGQGYKISNLYRNNAGGLLDTNSGTIKKLDIDVELYLVGACGGLCSTNNGNIEEVKVYGKIESISTAAGGSYTGAICFKNSGKIVNSYNYAPIKAVGAYVGGISGQNNGEIEQCKNEANLVGLNVIGGISGLNYNTIRECANTGNISTYNNGSYNIAGISAVNFDNTRYLKKTGSSMYADTVVSGKPFSAEGAERPVVSQGFVESSNVNVVNEMVQMIEVNRAYEANQKTIQAGDTMLNKLWSEVVKV